MSEVLIVVPRRSEAWRDRLYYEVVKPNLESTDYPVVEGEDEGPHPFNRSRAINQATQTRAWDYLVINDADTIIPPHRLAQALTLAEKTGRLVLPHDKFRSITREATHEILDRDLDYTAAPYRWETPNTKSSSLVLTREAWKAVGGFDERFEGWGFEDAAFYAASQALCGIERLSGPAYHLWHPRSPEKDAESPQYQANADLAAEYKRLRHDAEGMRAHINQPFMHRSPMMFTSTQRS